MLWIVSVWILLNCCFPFWGYAQNPEKKLRTITIVSDDNYPPYIFRGEKGKVQGILVDEWALWEKKTGIKVRLKAMDWGKAQEALEKGQADVIDTLFFTPERAKRYDFTRPYATIEVPVFFHKNIGGIINIQSLKGLTIGVKSGDACIEVLKKHGITSLAEYNSYTAIIEAAAEGQIKVFSIDKPPALYYLYKMNLENEFRYALTLYTGKFHRAVKKGRIDILRTVEDGFALIDEKELETIRKKWMGKSLARVTYYRYILYFLFLAGVIFLGLILFNMALQKKVRLKTAELQTMVRQLGLSEKRFRIIFEQAAVGVALCDSSSGKYIRVNQRYCDIVGYTSKEIMALSFEKITHHEDIQEDLDNMALLSQGKIREFSMKKRYIHKDGAVVWVKLTVSPMWKEGEDPTSHIAIVEDITKVKREESLQLAQLKLVEYGQTHSIKALLQKFLDEAEILTDSEIGFYHFVDEDQQAIPVQAWSSATMDGRCRVENPASHYLVSRTGVWADSVRMRKPVIHNDYAALPHKKGLPGGHMPVIRELVVPVIRGEKIVAILGVGNKKIDYDDHDLLMVQQLADMAWETITRKRIEEEIKKRETFLNAVIEHIPNMIFVKDAKTLRFIRFNKAGEKLVGLSKSEMLGKSDYDFFPKEEADFFAKKDRETFDRGDLIDIPEETIQTREKGTRILHTQKIPLFDENGKPEYLLGISEDITERKQMEEQLRQTQKMESIGNLAGGIAHDFNNILSGIFGFSQLAKHHIKKPEKAEKDIDQVIKVAQKARELVQQILAVSRKTGHKKQPVSVITVLMDALKLLRATIPATIEIKKTIESNATVMGDPAKIHQVIINLCTNAYHAMSDSGGIMEVCLEDIELGQKDITPGSRMKPGRCLKLEIRDTGHGIDPKIMDKIFEPYFTTKETSKGTGLGLAVVFGIVQEHKGHIDIQSRPGRGTVVRVYLPTIKAVPLTYTETKDKGILSGSERIMLVDDEPDILESLKGILSPHGYKVSVFNTGQAALKVFREDPDQFDLIITDMTMPEMTGETLSRAVLKIRETMPIILCTGYHESFNEEDALKMGIQKYVQKPVMGPALSKIIREVMDNRESRHNL